MRWARPNRRPRRGSDNVTGADNQQERPLNPWYVTGFIDAEGCFSVSIRPHPNLERPTRWLIAPVFQAYQHRDGIRVLEALQEFLGADRSSRRDLTATLSRFLSTVLSG